MQRQVKSTKIEEKRLKTAFKDNQYNHWKQQNRRNEQKRRKKAKSPVSPICTRLINVKT